MPRAAAKERLRPAKAFGALLKELRGTRSVEEVLQTLRGRPPHIDANQGTVSAYEQGYHLNPDPVILWGLAVMYEVHVEGLIAVLFANRANRYMSLDAARRVLQEHSHGPRPEVATAALEAAEKRIFEAVTELQDIREGLRAESGEEDGKADAPRSRR